MTTVDLAPPRVLDALRHLARLVDDDPQIWLASVPGAASLGEALYARWYTHPPTPPVPPATTDVEDPPVHGRLLTGALRAARASPTPGGEPWVVLTASPVGTLVVRRGEAVRQLRSGEYVAPTRPGVPPAPGELVEALVPFEMLDGERGLWWTFSDPPPEPPYGRVYLDARAATAARVVRVVVDVLGDIPFQLKCPVRPDALTRVDAIVLYHPRERRPEVLDALRGAPLDTLLDTAVPPLTCPVRPGCAWADDPGDDSSFGEHVCRALAAGIVAAGSTWAAATGPDRTKHLVTALSDAGIDPRHPWEVGT